jgi:Protein of unknown function (DUF3352)
MRVDPGHAQARRAARFSTIGLVLAMLAALPALTGCGSSTSTGTSTDPASVAPAASRIYLGAVVRPTGTLETDALGAGHKLTNEADPYTRLVAVLQTPGSPALDYKRDVAPWLGSDAGIFFSTLASSSSLESLLARTLTAASGGQGSAGAAAWPFGTGAAGGAQGAVVLDTSDLAKAKSFVESAAAHAGAHAASFRGVDYQATASGDAFAVVDQLVVLGTETGVHEVIETAQGGPSLKSDASYSQLLSVAPAGTLAHVYAAASAASSAPAHAGEPGLPALVTTLAGSRALNASLVPSGNSVALDADIGPPPPAKSAASGIVGAAAAGNHAFGELPGESWLAAGFGQIGGAQGGALEGLRGLLALVQTLGVSAGPVSPQATLSVKGLIEGISKPLGVLAASTPEARRDFRSWMGEAGIFVSGTTLVDLKGAIAITSTNPAASHAAVAKLAEGLHKAGSEASPTSIPGTDAAAEAKAAGLPVTFLIANGRDAAGQTKFVIGLSPASVQDALNPGSAMSSSAAYTAAQSALGEGIQPSIAVNLVSFLSVLEGFGLSEDPSLSGLLPAIRASTALSGGGKHLAGGVERLRLVLGLQPTTH